MKKLLLLAFALLLIFPDLSYGQAGKKLKIYGATFPSSFALYVLEPEILSGWNGPLRDYEKKWIPEKYHNLPILGGWYGKGMIPDKEVLLRARFDKALVLTGAHRQGDDSLPALKKLGFDIVALPNVSLADNINMFSAMGREFGVPERGEALAAYGREALARVAESMKDLPKEQYTRIYMAQDVDGLTTSCNNTARSEAFMLAGGINVNECPKGIGDATIKISFEHILRHDPDVILINHPTFMRHYQNDKKWQALRAAREGRVYFVPYEPFSWLDRPASFMRFMGTQWLAAKLHPEHFKIDLAAETDKFLRLFFRLKLSPEQIKAILEP